MTLQHTLTFEALDPEEVLKRAIKFKHSKLTTMAFLKTNEAATGGIDNNYNCFRVRVSAVILSFIHFPLIILMIF